VAGAGLAFTPTVLHADVEASQPEPINVALIGAGTQGLVLLTACLKIPGVRFTAVCDIWEAYNLRRASRCLPCPSISTYTDYEAMLDSEEPTRGDCRRRTSGDKLLSPVSMPA
jgi:threonine dehydrogenase-like Zn-dependent dehydrogenase